MKLKNHLSYNMFEYMVTTMERKNHLFKNAFVFYSDLAQK